MAVWVWVWVGVIAGVVMVGDERHWRSLQKTVQAYNMPLPSYTDDWGPLPERLKGGLVKKEKFRTL